MHAIPPNVYRACESVDVTQKSACEPVGVIQEAHDHNYFHTRSVVNKVHPKLINTCYVYTARMSPTLNGSSALQCFERNNVIEIRNGIMFDFYPGLPHMHILVHELVSVLESWEFVPGLCVKCNTVQIKPCNLHPMSIKYTLFACGYKEILCAFSTTQHCDKIMGQQQ